MKLTKDDLTWQFWVRSWSGEVASSGSADTFLRLKIWSSFFAFRSSTLVSTRLRRSSWFLEDDRGKLQISTAYNDTFFFVLVVEVNSRWRPCRDSWTGSDGQCSRTFSVFGTRFSSTQKKRYSSIPSIKQTKAKYNREQRWYNLVIATPNVH